MKFLNVSWLLPGVGHVGSAVLNCALAFNLAADIALIDILEEKAMGEALDASHGTLYAFSSQRLRARRGLRRMQGCGCDYCCRRSEYFPGANLDRLLLAESNVKTIHDVMNPLRSTQKTPLPL